MLGGYEFVESVTAEERIAGTWERDVAVRTGLCCLEHPHPLVGKGCVASNNAECGIWAEIVIGPK